MILGNTAFADFEVPNHAAEIGDVRHQARRRDQHNEHGDRQPRRQKLAFPALHQRDGRHESREQGSAERKSSRALVRFDLSILLRSRQPHDVLPGRFTGKKHGNGHNPDDHHRAKRCTLHLLAPSPQAPSQQSQCKQAADDRHVV